MSPPVTEADACVLHAVARHRGLARVDERLGPKPVAEPKLQRAAPQPLHVLEAAHQLPIAAEHRLEEAHAVLEPGIEGRDARLRHRDEGTGEPRVEHRRGRPPARG